MKPIIAILTGLHVLAHGVFGCCDHGLVVAARAETACACHHTHDHADEAARSGDCDAIERDAPAPASHECVHATCHWVAGSDGPSATTLDLVAPALMVSAALPANPALLAAEYQPDDILGRTSAPPLRLHLALGVLVI
jgi:hypothetical protein